jgi:outer membrane protein assembly factor BamB
MSLLHEQPLTNITGVEGKAYCFHCPACGEGHFYAVDAKGGPSWMFNGSMDSPTFTPSLKVGGVEKMTDAEYDAIMRGEKIAVRPKCCHLNITNGKIIYQGDCTHSMRGTTINMVDFDE